MALILKVTNQSGEQFRARHHFPEGFSGEVEINPNLLNEIIDAPDLDVSFVSADDPMELPPEYRDRFSPPASEAAKRLARENVVDLYSVQASGKSGQITQDDVKEAIEKQRAVAEEHGLVTTLSPKEEQRQRRAEEEERIEAASVGEPPPPDEPTRDAEVVQDLAERDVPTEGGGTPEL